MSAALEYGWARVGGQGERTARYPLRDDSAGGSRITDASTQPLPQLGGPAGVLAVQLARFGELAGRDLCARAAAALRVSRAQDPRRRGEEWADAPLTPAEHQEMTSLHAAINGACLPADPGSAAARGQAEPVSLRPLRLRRRPVQDSVRSAGRHHRPAVTGQAG